MRPLVIDGFAGGGGASEGIRRAIGRGPDIAINHDPEAIAMHEANHPEARHYCESIYDVGPVEACKGGDAWFAWFSPDCTHHSRARGGKPRQKNIRGLAWVVTKWARAVRPAIIMVENVEEFRDWGPLDEHDQPIESRKGETFREWVGQLEKLGYEVDHRTLVACDFGAPTSRKRLFIVARCDGMPIVWPEPTHGHGRARPHRTAAEIIDWTIPRPSIFARKKPLAEATLRRIATGVRRYVLGGNPYVVGDVAGTMVHIGNGERQGQAPRALDIRKPLGTVVAQGAKHCLVAALLTKHFGGVVGHEVTRPIGTVTAIDHHALTTATLTREGCATVDAFLGKYAPANNQTSLFASDVVVHEGERYRVADIGTRMLGPRELFNAQGFPRDYVIDPMIGGRPLSKTKQIAKVGNSVCPDVAEALVRANIFSRAEAAE